MKYTCSVCGWNREIADEDWEHWEAYQSSEEVVFKWDGEVEHRCDVPAERAGEAIEEA